MIRHSKMPRPLVVRNFIAILSLSGEYRVEAIVNNGVPKGRHRTQWARYCIDWKNTFFIWLSEVKVSY